MADHGEGSAQLSVDLHQVRDGALARRAARWRIGEHATGAQGLQRLRDSHRLKEARNAPGEAEGHELLVVLEAQKVVEEPGCGASRTLEPEPGHLLVASLPPDHPIRPFSRDADLGRQEPRATEPETFASCHTLTIYAGTYIGYIPAEIEQNRETPMAAQTEGDAATIAIDLREMARRLSVSRSYGYRLVQPTGPIPTVTVGKRKRVLLADLEAYLAATRTTS